MWALMLVTVEVVSLVAYKSGIFFLSEPRYRPAYFECRGCRYRTDKSVPDPNLKVGGGLYDSDLGWDSYRDGKRSGPLGLTYACGSAFGDSFTYGDEVGGNEAWAFLLSQKLGCEIENFGVNGYGLDQAYLKYLKYRPVGHFVILALYQEMLRRNFAASWRPDLGLADDPVPFGRFGPDVGGELVGPAADGFEADRVQSRPDVRQGNDADDLAMQDIDDRLGRGGGNQHALHRFRVVAGEAAFRQGRYARQIR